MDIGGILLRLISAGNEQRPPIERCLQLHHATHDQPSLGHHHSRRTSTDRHSSATAISRPHSHARPPTVLQGLARPSLRARRVRDERAVRRLLWDVGQDEPAEVGRCQEHTVGWGEKWDCWWPLRIGIQINQTIFYTKWSRLNRCRSDLTPHDPDPGADGGLLLQWILPGLQQIGHRAHHTAGETSRIEIFKRT